MWRCSKNASPIRNNVLSRPATSPARQIGQAALTQLVVGLTIKLGANFCAVHFLAERDIAERAEGFGYVLIGLSVLFASIYLSINASNASASHDKKCLRALDS